jgi:Holliday junction DNA helicase RuvA
VLELKDKVPKLSFADAGLAQVSAELNSPLPTAVTDAVSALVNLGYGQSQAAMAVSAAMRKSGNDQPTEKLIRAALKEMASG